MKQPHHRGAHQRLSAAARAAYNANPATVCARCGLTRTQGIQRYGRRAGQWQAGHRIDGHIATSVADYQPEHAHCNASAGAALGNRQRTPVNSREW
ncbi:MAG: hypothetical protein AAGA37_19840 [Actinomycetota bacterium]